MPRVSIARRFDNYVETLGAGLYRPCARFLREAVFGLLSRRSVMLSDVGRSLNEPMKLIYSEKRLSRNLCTDRFDDHAVERDYVDIVKPLFKKGPAPVVAVDLTDIRKWYSKAQPYLHGIWDGSRHEQGIGYEVVTCEAVGDGAKRMPLCMRMFSPAAPDYRSQNEEVLAAVDHARQMVPEESVFVFDRGFDSRRFFAALNSRRMLWVIRTGSIRKGNNRPASAPGGKNKNRVVWANGVRCTVDEVPKMYPSNARYTLKRGRHTNFGLSWVTTVGVGVQTASGHVPNRPGPEHYSIVIIHGTGKKGDKSLVMLTNITVHGEAEARMVADSYFKRWGAEVAHRFEKQAFDLENVRALTWRGLKRIVLLVMLAYGFLALLEHKARKQVAERAERFRAFGPVPEYFYYRLLEGIAELVVRVVKRARCRPSPLHDTS